MSTDFSHLAGGRSHETPVRPAVVRGRIVRAPATSSDTLEVIIIGYSAAYPFTVAAQHWRPAAPANLPPLGAHCVVLFDDRGDAWVAVWEGPYVGTVAGGIAAAGTIAAGSGFTVTRTVVGQYAVTFTTPFPAVPALAVTPVGAGASTATITLLATGFTVYTYTGSPAVAADVPFTFIAAAT